MGLAILVFPPRSYRHVARESVRVSSTERLRDGIREELSKAAAERVTRPAWDAITVNWDVEDFGGFNSGAELVQNLDAWEHYQPGKWLSQLVFAVGLPSGMADGAGTLLGLALPLPGEKFLDQLSTVIKLAGIVFAVASGNPVAACASLKSLVHEEMVDAVAKVIRADVGVSQTPSAKNTPHPPGAPGI